MMGGRGIHGGSNMAVLLQNDAIFSQNIKGMFGSGNSSAGFMSAHSAMNFQHGNGSRVRQPSFWPVDLDEGGTDEFDDCLTHAEKKRRLSVDQVQFLEKSFEVDNKLEPERKVQLAKDLGLQPRQVAIWFQNRRARWKTKQLEKEYEVLKCGYDSLKVDYDSLMKEKEELQSKVLSLTNMLLQKEKKGDKLESPDSHKLPYESPRVGHSEADTERVEKPRNVCKQEDMSSANSIVLDSESPHCIDGGYSSTGAFEPAQSDHSQIGEVDEVKGCGFLGIEDQSLWSFWS